MTFTFRPATRENVGLLIGLIGPSGSGKTYSAMRLAAGIAGDKPFAVIDTEAGAPSTMPTSFASTTATCVMRLVDDDQAKWSISEALHYGFSFAAVEALG